MKRKNKRCPRCNFKVDSSTNTCPACRLNYQKFNMATNAEAKKAMREGDKDRVVFRTGVPSDIKKWQLILITIFLGFCGGHYFYTGRKNRGLFYFCFFVVGVVNAVINLITGGSPKGDMYQIFYLLVLVWGIVVVLWLVDIIKVCFNRFKVPVSLPRED